MTSTLPVATIRTQLVVPLEFADGFATRARVFSFDGLVDGQEHLALGLGDRVSALRQPGRPAAAGAAAQRVPDRRRVRQPALRLRAPAARVGRADRRGRRLPALPAAGGTRHRAVPQARRLPAPGRRPRHLRGQPGPRLRGRCPRLQRRRADAAGPGGVAGRPAQQQPGQGRAARPARASPSPSGCRRGCTSHRRTRATSRPRPAWATTRWTGSCSSCAPFPGWSSQRALRTSRPARATLGSRTPASPAW